MKHKTHMLERLIEKDADEIDLYLSNVSTEEFKKDIKSLIRFAGKYRQNVLGSEAKPVSKKVGYSVG